MQAYTSQPAGNERLLELQQRMAELQNAPNSVLHTRLARAHPWHVARLARGLFLGLTVICVVLLIGSLVLPMLLPEAAVFMASVDRALPVPFPVLAVILALCMAVAWVTSGQAALSIARDCPLLPWEDEEMRKVENEIRLLAGTSTFVTGQPEDEAGPPPLYMPNSQLAYDSGGDRAGNSHSGNSYSGNSFSGNDIRVPRPGGTSHPTPASTPRGTLQYESVRDPFSGGGPPLGNLPPTVDRTGTPRPVRDVPGRSAHNARAGTPRPAFSGSLNTPNSYTGAGRTLSASAGNLPRAATPRPAGATPNSAAGRAISARGASPRTSLSYRGPDGEAARSGTPRPAPRVGADNVVYSRSPMDGYTIGPEGGNDPISGDLSGNTNWRTPQWGPIDEPWLQDALRKADQLTRRYPVQAFLEYSVEPDLPFTLVLERATPAMAVRAMVDFVGFLASIAPPRRARIELRSVVHLDRSFYRSVMSAMEPYFPDSVDIRQQGYRVEITFLEPDRNWARYPILPTAE